MAKLLHSVKNGVTKLVRWAFENDKVSVDTRFVRNNKNYRV